MGVYHPRNHRGLKGGKGPTHVPATAGQTVATTGAGEQTRMPPTLAPSVLEAGELSF